MKRQGVYNLSLFLVLLLTSCMGDGGNFVNYHRVGVVREKSTRCIYTCNDVGDIFIISSPDFEGKADVKDGDCCLVDFKTGFSEDLGGGIYKADIFKYETVDVWPLLNTLTDTSKVRPKERLVSLDFKKSIYLDGNFFLQTLHVNHQADQKDIFNLSYDPNQVVEVNDKGQRIYHLYLRVTQDGGTGSSLNWIKTTAFTIREFMDQAKAIESKEGQDAINFKVNYALSFNADTTACVWGGTDIFTLRFTK